MSQTTISAGGQAIGDAGDVADSGPKDVVSGFNQNAVQMPFGYGLADGTSRDFYALPTGMSNAFPVGGVLLRRANYMPQITLNNGTTVGDQGASGLLQNAPLNVMRRGRVLVPVESGVSVGQRAWCRGVATGAFTQGSWRGAAVGASPSGVGGGAAVSLGASYFLDCSRMGVFRSGSFTAADGSTVVAVLEVDFTTGVV